MARRGKRIWVVDQKHRRASNKGDGTELRPLGTINRAAELAEPGDTVLVKAGVYRERVNPRRGGLEGRPIIYQADEGHKIFLRGSEEFRPAWRSVKGHKGLYSGSLRGVAFGTASYAGHVDASRYGEFNPYLLNFNRAKIARPQAKVIERIRETIRQIDEQLSDPSPGTDIISGSAQRRKADLERELGLRARKTGARYLTTLGQVFVDSLPLAQVETMEDVIELPGTWIVSPEGDAVLVHFPAGASPKTSLVELTTRHTVFAPLERGLGHIHVRGFVIEHGANHFPTWGKTGWPQVGLLSCRSGHHWVIENNIVRYATGLGIDCGSEGSSENLEQADGDTDADRFHSREKGVEGILAGRHVIRDNLICDNGHCGIAGIRHVGTQIVGNVIERNNRTGWTSPWWEFGGVKFHFLYDGLIEGNLIRDNEAHGIWIDNQWRGSRITRNVIVNNLWSGINVELGRGPVLIDNNVIACTRQGDGIYGHDASDVTMAHNLIYANANFGIWFAYCTPRVRPEDGCWDIRAFNNMILGNRAGAIGYPMPWDCAGNNLSDGNLLMGAGEYLDEGSGPMPPLFQFTNRTHVGQMPQHLPREIEAQTTPVVRRKFVEALEKAAVPKDAWPNLDWWDQHYLVPLDIWRTVLGNDRDSKVMRCIRDGLQSRVVSLDVAFDDTLRDVDCRTVNGVDEDFFGRAMPDRPLPGPFQDLQTGHVHLMLWPVRGIRTTWALP